MQNEKAAQSKNRLRIYLDLVADGAARDTDNAAPSIPPERLAAKQREVGQILMDVSSLHNLTGHISPGPMCMAKQDHLKMHLQQILHLAVNAADACRLEAAAQTCFLRRAFNPRGLLLEASHLIP